MRKSLYMASAVTASDNNNNNKNKTAFVEHTSSG